MSPFLSALEKGVAKKMHEDLELQNVTRKNKGLVETMKQVTSEAQNWCYMAKYNESVVNILKTNLQQARFEVVGESDDAASYVGGSSPSISAKKDSNMICRSCRSNFKGGICFADAMSTLVSV
ncbi:hypothetical protein CASFOL_003675 [Castilleja foliolosa]|uniref:Uncharacterized protein n=1 Tax=Castilleja foliolosa TaxID=1961234 RepID=A0ABD3EL77_9LAMI